MLVYNIRKAANSGFEELYDLKILYGYTCKLRYLPFVCGHWSHTKDFKAVCKAKAVSSFSFILRPPTAWVLVWNRGLSQRAPHSAIKPSTRLLNNQIHKAKWKLDTTLHKTVLLSEAKIETITNLMTSAIIPPITSGSSQEMIHYDWQVQVLPLNFQTRHKWTCKLFFFFKFMPKYRIHII